VPKTDEEHGVRYDVSKAGKILGIVVRGAGEGKSGESEGREGVGWYKTMEESTRNTMEYFR
jgi:hypothetical protein